jgi:hypothetical protein
MMEQQAAQRTGWLASAVFMANGGIMALAGLIAGVAAAAASEGDVLVAAVAGLVAGAIALASAEYGATLARSDGRLPATAALASDRLVAMDLAEATALYRRRGLSAELAEEAALAATDPRAARIGMDEARPIEAALGAATSFAAGAAVPVTLASLFPLERMALGVGLGSTVVAMALAALAARGSAASPGLVMARVALGCVAAVAGGYLVGSVVGPALA